MEHKENNFLEQEPVGKLMMKYAVPCIISRKWADPVDTFWRVACASSLSQKAFAERCRNWRKRRGCNCSEQKAMELLAAAKQ